MSASLRMVPWPLPEELITGFTTTGQPSGAATRASSAALAA